MTIYAWKRWLAGGNRLIWNHKSSNCQVSAVGSHAPVFWCGEAVDVHFGRIPVFREIDARVPASRSFPECHELCLVECGFVQGGRTWNGKAVPFAVGIIADAISNFCTVRKCNLGCFLQLVGQIQSPIMSLLGMIPQLIHASASVDRLVECCLLRLSWEFSVCFDQFSWYDSWWFKWLRRWGYLRWRPDRW